MKGETWEWCKQDGGALTVVLGGAHALARSEHPGARAATSTLANFLRSAVIRKATSFR